RPQRLPSSLNLYDDLSPGSTLLEIQKRLFRLIEREDLVDHGPDASRLEKFADVGELAAVGMHEQEGILGAALPGMANDLTAQQREYEHHEKVHASRATERGVRWTD